MNQIRRRSRNVKVRRLIGIDASLRSTGYAFIDSKGVPVTDRITPGTKKGSARLWHNLLNLQRILDNAQPEVLVIEGYAMGAKGHVFQIGEWGGTIRLEAYRRGIEVITVTPGTLKYVATGSGAASKEQMMQACEDLFGTTIKQDDEADAFLLYCFGQALLYNKGPKSFVDRVLEKNAASKSGIDREVGSRVIV